MATLCRAGGDFRGEIDAAWPKRDRTSDGWLGDSAHSQRTSDHNPNSAGVVRAIDVDVDGVPIVKLVELFRATGARGDRRLRGGYVIYNRRIAGTHTDWKWHEYTGENPHTHHAHFSFADAAADYSFRGPWNVASLKATGHSHRVSVIKHGDSSTLVKDYQGHLNVWLKSRKLPTVPLDGKFSGTVHNRTKTFQQAYGLTADGVVGPQTWSKIHAITKGARAS